MHRLFFAPLLRLCSAALLYLLFSTGLFAQTIEVISGNVQQIQEHKSEKLVVWNLQNQSKVFVFDFPNLTMQGKTFNRVTYFTEQAVFSSGYPKVYNNAEMQEYFDSVRRNQANFAFGHDVQVQELVQFFNLIERDKIEIYTEEVQLRNFLLEQGLIKFWRGFYQAVQPEVVLLSIPQLQARRADEPAVTETIRRTIFQHELAHAEYFTNEYYANYCRTFWNESLTDEQRKAFTDFLSNHNYNIYYADLVVNEMQAYLMHTADAQSFSAAKIGVSEKDLETMRKMFRQGNPVTKLIGR